MAFNVGIINPPIRTAEPVFRYKMCSSRHMCARVHSDLLLNIPVDADTSNSTARSMFQTELKAPSNLSFNGPMSYGPHLKLKGFVLNLWGLANGLSLLVSSILLLPMLFILTAIADITGDTKVSLVLPVLCLFYAVSSNLFSQLYLHCFFSETSRAGLAYTLLGSIFPETAQLVAF